MRPVAQEIFARSAVAFGRRHGMQLLKSLLMVHARLTLRAGLPLVLEKVVIDTALTGSRAPIGPSLELDQVRAIVHELLRRLAELADGDRAALDLLAGLRAVMAAALADVDESLLIVVLIVDPPRDGREIQS